MKLKEFLGDFSFFNELQIIEPQFFIDGNGRLLDSMLLANYGERLVFINLVDIELVDLVQMVALTYSKAWASLEGLEINLNEGNKITETINRVEDRLNTRDDVSKISAFNSEAMVNDGGNNSTGTDGLVGETIRTVIDEKVNLKLAYESMDIASKNSIINIVLGNVASFLTLSIY